MTATLETARAGTPNRISAREVSQRIGESACLLLDVRGFDEFAAGHAASALCIPLPDLERRAGQIPTDKPVFVMCGSGYRSSIACSLLQRAGHTDVVNVVGGWTAWMASGPTSKTETENVAA